MSSVELQVLEKEITESVQRCFKCRMCVEMCPTYEGWFTQSTAGRLMAINLYIKHGLGSIENLANMLYACTTCRRCQERCRMLSTDCRPADTIIKARRYLVQKAKEEERES